MGGFCGGGARGGRLAVAACPTAVGPAQSACYNAFAAHATMPTILTWVFDGGDDSSDASDRMQARATRRGERQRVHSGDKVEDDVLGVGIIEKIDGGYMTIIFGSGDTQEIKERTCGHATAVVNIEEVAQRAAKGHQQQGNNLAALFGVQAPFNHGNDGNGFNGM